MNHWDIDPQLYLSIWRGIFRAIRRVFARREISANASCCG